MRSLTVSLIPNLMNPRDVEGGVVVCVDILRASTTIIHALAAGATKVIAVEEIDLAKSLAKSLPPGDVLLAGERQGLPIDGFDLGNSPAEFTGERCSRRTVIFTTTNGTRAIAHARRARRLLIGGFVNFSAICRELLEEEGDIHILCAGTDGKASLEDTVYAGALVYALDEHEDFDLDDAARIAWDTFEGHGCVLQAALELGQGGRNLIDIGLGGDLAWAARVDRFGIVPEVQGDPAEITVARHRTEDCLFRR